MNKAALTVRDNSLVLASEEYDFRPLRRGISLYWSQWGQPFWNNITVEQLKLAWQADFIRLPLGSHADHLGFRTPEGMKETLEQAYQVIDAAISYKMYVVVDCHDHHAVQHITESSRLLYEVAKKYGDNPYILYEVVNEPLDVTWGEIKEYADFTIRLIRSKAPNAVCIVGTPEWCTDLTGPIQSPLNTLKDIMYSFHFYAGSHRKEDRENLEAAIKKEVPIFVTECGASDADGNGTINYDGFDRWLNLLEVRNQIPWCAWALNDKKESSSMLHEGSRDLTKNGSYTDYGIFIRGRILSPMGESTIFNPYTRGGESPFGDRGAEDIVTRSLMKHTVTIPVTMLPALIASFKEIWNNDDIALYLLWLSNSWGSLDKEAHRVIRTAVNDKLKGMIDRKESSIAAQKTRWALKRLQDTMTLWVNRYG